MRLDDQVTVLIPTSPIPRHPATELIEQCVDAIRFYLPTAKILIMCDGVRPSVENRRGQYAEYLKNLAAVVNSGKMGNTELKVFTDFSQQAIMTKNVLHHYVHTPLMMFVEHDAILRTEPKIFFELIFDALLDGTFNLVRFYNWNDIWHEHEHLMRGDITRTRTYMNGDVAMQDVARFVKTVQYSQWPLISRTDYHKRLLDEVVPGRYTMIEPMVYYRVAGEDWEKNKIGIYIDGLKTFTHVDGRVDPNTGRKDPGEW